ncbi:hypothetical protein X975_12566, partial [Stegodyphus mimosarum]
MENWCYMPRELPSLERRTQPGKPFLSQNPLTQHFSIRGSQSLPLWSSSLELNAKFKLMLKMCLPCCLKR